jgi:hypothetical protein
MRGVTRRDRTIGGAQQQAVMPGQAQCITCPIIAVSAVKADDIVAEALQVSGHRGADITAMPRDQNPHGSIIGRRPAAMRTDLLPDLPGMSDLNVRHEARSGYCATFVPLYGTNVAQSFSVL